MLKFRTIIRTHIEKTLMHSERNKKRIVYSSFPEIPTRKESIAEYVFSKCDKYSDKIAFIDDSRKINYSYSDVKQMIKNIASALVKSGLQPGSMVAIVAQNSPEYLMLIYAISSMGCSVTLQNPNYTSSELKYYLYDSKPSIIFTDENCIEKVIQVCKPNMKIYLIGNRKPGYLAVDDLMNDSGNMNPIGQIELDLENHLALLPYSSGTTGLPKGVMLTHNSLVSNFHQMMAAHRIDNKVLLMSLPLFHIYGLNTASSIGINSGSTIVFQPKFHPLSFLGAIEKYKVSMLQLVPPQILFLLNNQNVSQFNVSSIEKVLSGGAPLDAQIESLLIEKFQNDNKDFGIYQVYGLTEVSGASHLFPVNESFQKRKHGSIGQLLPYMQCKVVNISTHEELPANNNGELMLRGPTIMKGYFGKIKETEQCFKNEWFKTGDIGHYDDENYFYITDRIKEMFKVKGFQVSPAELETTLLLINGVEDCAVIGVPDERCGRVPKAFIVKNREIDENEIHDFMKKNLSEFKQLKGGIVFVNEIPKTPSGKTLKRLLE